MNAITSTGEKLAQLVIILLISLMCASMLYPFIHLISISFSSPEAAMQQGFHLWPKQFSFASYDKAIHYRGIWTGYANTIFRTVVGTLLSLVFITMTAYALSKKRLPHRRFYTMFIVTTLFFNGGLIPTYLLVKNIGLMDSSWALILPMLINTFSLLVMRNFFMGIPHELEESAKLDGANDIRILVSIIVPLSKPILATVTLWMAVSHWNAWFDALIYIQSESKMVLQIFLRRIIIENSASEIDNMMQFGGQNVSSPETVKAAVLLISTLPILIGYPFIQKYFAKGIFIGSVKG